MNNCYYKRALPVICMLATGLYATQGFADWFNNAAQRNYNQGYGDFPPASVTQQPRRSSGSDNRAVDRTPRDYRDSNPRSSDYQPADRAPRDSRNSNPWSSDYQPAPVIAPNYQAPNKPLPVYRGYDRGRSDSPFVGSVPSVGHPWGNRGSSFQGPWHDRGTSFSPWGRRGGGNRDPFGDRGPRDWIDPDKRSISRNWDDMLNSPSRMGEMPGGWSAPSVSAPNPVDVGDEFNDAARDLPEQMDNFQWNDNRRRY